MNVQTNSDPLPYAQVDRAVKPKAATLATMVGVTYQHALGSLAEFWEACGDPRELERLCAAGKDEVVLSRDEVSARLFVAFGKPVDPDACRHLGLLEARPEGFRVRGMSRYFGPIKRRLQARVAASAGGKASAASRLAKTGSAQPKANPTPETPENRSEPSSTAGSTAGSGAASSAASGSLRDHVEASTEAPPNTAVSGQRSAVSGQPLEEEALLLLKTLPDPPLPATPDDKFASGHDFWAFFQLKRHEVGLVTEKLPRSSLSVWWSEVGMALNGQYERLETAAYRFAESKHWRKAAPPVPFNAFMSEWRNCLPQANRT